MRKRIKKALTFMGIYAKINPLNRGADEHQYRRRENHGRVFKKSIGKGYLRRSAIIVPIALGIRANTRLTVTHVKSYLVSCIPKRLAVGFTYIIAFSTGQFPVFSFRLIDQQKGDFEIMKQFNVGVIGATGMVGQRFMLLLENHPWFRVTVLAASARSAGKTYAEAVGEKWAFDCPMPEKYKSMTVLDAEADMDTIAANVDFVFCAVNMDKAKIRALEEAYAKKEVPVVSNNSAHRFTADVPMVIPEINDDHLEVIAAQKARLGTKRGFIAVKSNCSLQSYVPLLHPLKKYGVKEAAVCTYQAISGAGKTFKTMPEILDNIIPYIGGEEEKSEKEPLKIWGSVENGEIVSASSPAITAQCLRVPVSDGHTAAVFVKFENKPSKEEILDAWANFKGAPQELELPSAPKQFLKYFEEDNRPQAKLDRMEGNGMSVTAGRLREDSVYDYKFVGLSHNTLRGAAGGAVLLAELLAAKGYMD